MRKMLYGSIAEPRLDMPFFTYALHPFLPRACLSLFFSEEPLLDHIPVPFLLPLSIFDHFLFVL